ncbi:MAG: TIGR01212 family radical SAM protein [bacterium]
MYFSQYLKEELGEKVYKVPVDGGFTCPNIDGSKGTGGCVYCKNESFRPDYVTSRDTIEQQVTTGIERLQNRSVERYMVYFQSYTNTYADPDPLKSLYDRALQVKNVVGLCIGTRPDCVDEKTLELLSDYSGEGYHVWLELGLQTSNDVTQSRVNRLHTFEKYGDVIDQLREYPGIRACVHVMFGLPGENTADMVRTIKDVRDPRLDGIKFHQTQVIRGTELADWYKRDRYQPISLERYKFLVVNALERLPADLVIHRLVASSSPKWVLAPEWDVSKHEIHRDIKNNLRNSDILRGL